MKKLLSILLATLMLLSCFSITASAETVYHEVSVTEEFCNAVTDYIIDADMGDSFFPILWNPDTGESKYQGFTPENIHSEKMSDKIKIYAETSTDAVFELFSGAVPGESVEIDGYVFTSSNLFHSEINPTGFCYYTDGKVYSLEEAVEQGLAYPRILATYIPNTINNTEHGAEEMLLAEKFNSSFQLTKLGDIGEYGLFYDLSDMPAPWSPYAYIGNYKFITANSKLYENPGLYVVSDTTAYTLEEAWYADIVTDMDAVAEMIKAHSHPYAFDMIRLQKGETKTEQLFINYMIENNKFMYGPEDESGQYSFGVVGEVNGYKMCLARTHLEPVGWSAEIGGYRISTESYCCECIFFINESEVYSVTEAVEKGIIRNMYSVVEILKNKTHFEITRILTPTEKMDFYGALNDYINNAGLSSNYPIFTQNNIFTHPKIEIYYEDEYRIIFRLKSDDATDTKEYLENYTFTSDTFFHESNPCGYFSYTNELRTLQQSDADIMAKYIPTAVDNDPENPHNAFLKYVEENRIFTDNNSYDSVLRKIGVAEGYILYYAVGDMLLPGKAEKNFGNYKFSVTQTEFFSDTPWNLYAVKEDGEEILTFEQAYDDGKISDMDAVCELLLSKNIDYTFTIVKLSDEPITPPVDDNPVTDILVVNGKFEAGEQAPFFASGNTDVFTAFSSDNEKVATVDENGVVTALKKGTAKITATGENKTFTYEIKVINNPKLNKKTVTVNRNKTVKVKLTGKVAGIENTYKNTKKVEIISGKNATKLKIKGLKKGTTTLKIKVNGVKTLKLKVNVV